MNVRYVVSGRIVSEDSTLLDTIESELPDEGDVILGNEFRKSREPEKDESDTETGAEILSVRMTFASEDVELEDGTVVTPRESATALFDSVVSHELATKASGWTVRLYRSPEGGVTVSDVREWYESHPDEQPTREAPDGSEEPYVPNRWNPNNHVLTEETHGSN